MSVVSLPAVRCHKVYDPWLRNLVFRTGDVSFAKGTGQAPLQIRLGGLDFRERQHECMKRLAS
jgi:hypothetical protein